VTTNRGVVSDEHDRRAREYIEDVLRINTEHGIRNTEDQRIIEAAVADVAGWARRLHQLAKTEP
jgi:hypothetical protein